MRKLSPKGQTWLISLLLVISTLGVYWQVVHFDFIRYDDQEYVTENKTVQQGWTRDGIIWAFAHPHAANWHPVTWLSHMLDCQIFGLKASGHHLTNVVLHLANTLLLFFLLRSMTGAVWRSAVVAALFALHPLHVESVAWISERKDVLSALFGLLALWAYATYARCSDKRVLKRLPLYLLALLLFLLGLMSKPMLVTIPFVMLLLDFWPLNRMTPCRAKAARCMVQLCLEKIPFFALSLVFCFVTLAAQSKAIVHDKSLSFGVRLANAAVSCALYLEKTFWPDRLAIIYPHPGSWPLWKTSSAVMVLLAISLLAFRNLKQLPWLSVGWLWFLGMLVPVLGLVQVGVQSMADRYTYLPLIGVFVMLVWGASEVVMRTNRFSLVAQNLFVILLAACTIRTGLQLPVWKNTETIFSHAAAVTRQNWVAEHNLALLALTRYQETQRGSLEKQLLDSSKLSGSPGDYLSEVILRCGNALRAKPDYSYAHITLAKVYTEQGRLAEAENHVKIAIQIDPENAESRQILGEIFSRQGYAKEAVVQYKRALRNQPDWAPVLNNLAWILATHRDPETRDGALAVRLAERACDLTGRTNLWFIHTLAAAYAEAGDTTNAVASAERARDLASATGQDALTRTAEKRIELYRSGGRYRD
jgi:cytochrome c-type biogenesis protein CcmH/NrfG